MKVYRLAEWRGGSHSTRRDRQQRERVAVGLLCIYIYFFESSPLFLPAHREYAHLRSRFSTLGG